MENIRVVHLQSKVLKQVPEIKMLSFLSEKS